MSSGAPLFSIVVIDYDKSVSRSDFRRKMKCLSDQTCKDFEVLVYHDGPKAVPYEEDVKDIDLHPNTKFVITERHEDDWGHSNRDRGIRAASGEWIIHTNADNLFYPNLVETLKEKALKASMPVTIVRRRRLPIIVKSIARRSDKILGTSLQKVSVSSGVVENILVYPILMRGVFPFRNKWVRVKEKAADGAVVLSGIPVRYANVNLMQVVLRRKVWLAEGGWHDKRENSDGHMYERFAKKYNVLAITQILGEHW